MKTKAIILFSYFISFASLAFSGWVSIINLQEIVNRANGKYTFFSQRASLTDNEAVIYFAAWTLLFISISYLIVRRLMNKKYVGAIICAVYLILLIVLSTFIDQFFYYPLP